MSKQRDERFAAQPAEVRRTATEVSKEYSNIIGEDITTPNDGTKVFKLLDDGVAARDKEGNAAVTYLSKVERTIDGLYLAIFDVANQTKQFRQTPDMPQGEIEFYNGMGNKPAQLTLAWAKKNLSKETNAWIDTTLEKELRNVQRIENTDYIELFRAREAKIAAREAAEQAQIDLEDQEDLRANLDELALDELTRIFEKKITRNAVVAMDAPMHPRARVMIGTGNLKGALEAIAGTTPNTKLSTAASKLAGVAGDTKVEVVEDLQDAQGNPVAGLFDPETNTVKLDSVTGTNTHVVLHEVTHAAVSATLANPSHPVTKQLTKLFNDVKDMLDSAYGAQDVDEFVSEAFSNPEFQKKLATMNPNGEEISALQRFFNSVGNFLRKIVGIPPKEVDSALTEADRFIEAILAPAPDSRNAGELLMNSTRSGVKQKMEAIGAIQKDLTLPLTDKFRGEWADGSAQWLRNAADGVRSILPKLTGSLALADIAKAVGLKDLGLRLHVSFENQRGAMSQSDDRVHQKVKVVDKWASKAGVEGQKTLNDLIYSEEYGATIYQVDPTLTTAQARKKYEGETSESGENLLTIWKAQRKDWNALGSEGQNAYTTMRDMYRSQYNELRDVIYGRIDAAMKESPEAAATLKKEVYAKLFESGSLDVYFPLMREGKYSLSFSYKADRAKSEKDQFVLQMFDNYRERDRAAEMLQEDADVDQSTITTKDGALEIQDYANVPATSFVGETLKTLKANKVDPTVQAEIMRLFIEALPESSFAKSLQKRKGTPGYMTDAIYAMRTKGYDLGRQIERMRYGAIIGGIEDEIKEALPPAGGGQGKGIKPAFDTVRSELLIRGKFARQGAASKGIEKYVRTVNQLAFVATIGANAASAAVNLSQIPLFVYPYLGAKYGYKATAVAIKEATAIVTGSKIGTDAESRAGKALDKVTLAFGIDAYYDTKDGDYSVRTDLGLDAGLVKRLETIAPLVKVASERGQLSRSYILDALGLEEGGREARGNKLQRALDTGTGISAMMFNQAERFNRQVTLITTYNLALGKIAKDNPNMPRNKQKDLAAQQAMIETQETNGGSVLETAPRVAQENVLRVASMYKTYGMQMYYTMLKTARVALDTVAKEKKFTPEERSIALRQLAGLHGTALFFSGIHGIPLYGAVQLLADLLLFDDEDDKFDEIVRKSVGQGWYKGAFTELTGINIADRVRLTGLLIQQNRYNNDPSAEESIGYYLGGPALSVGKRFGRGVKDVLDGEIQRGIESMLPAGISNMYKASPVMGRYQQDGGIYTRRGDPIYDDITGGELFTQFLGFAPTEYSRNQEINQRDKRVEGAVLKRRSGILRKYYVAMRAGDLAGVNEVREEMDDFNRDHPSARIDRETVKKSLKSHKNTSAKMYNGVTISPLMKYAIEQSRLEYDEGFNLFN